MPSEKQYLANQAELVSTVYWGGWSLAFSVLNDKGNGVGIATHLAAEYFIANDQARSRMYHLLASFLCHS